MGWQAAGWCIGAGDMGIDCYYPGCASEPRKMGLCERHFGNRDQRRFAQDRVASARGAGSVNPSAIYVISASRLPFLKVGKSFSPAERLAQMQTGCPFDMHVHYIGYSTDAVMRFFEGLVHRALRAGGHHYRGEWFSCNVDEAISAIQSTSEKFDMPLMTADALIDKIHNDKALGVFCDRNFERDVDRARLALTAAAYLHAS